MESSLSLTFSDIQHMSPGSLEPGPEWTSLPILFSKWLRRMYSWDRLYVLDKDLSLCPPPWPPNADLIAFPWKVGWVVKGSLEPDLPGVTLQCLLEGCEELSTRGLGGGSVGQRLALQALSA